MRQSWNEPLVVATPQLAHLLNIIVVIVVIGVGLWAINRFIPMARPVKTIHNVVVVAFLCLWLLQTFGIIGNIKSIRVG